MGATSNWNISDADFPTSGTPRQRLGFAVKQAMLVSPECPWQPCEFRMSEHFVELIAKDGPRAESFDPEGRETMISCGVSLQYLKLALKHHRCLGRVEFFPDLDEPALVARIHVGCSGERDAQESRLFEVMKPSRTNSFWPDRSQATEKTLDTLACALARERGWLEFARSEASRQRLQRFASARERLQVDEVRFQDETPTWATADGWESDRFISSFLHERPARWRRPQLALRVQTSSKTTYDLLEEGEFMSSAGTFAVLKTKTDDKHGWVAAGQTMARLILRARTLGLSYTFFNEVLRRPAVRAELRTGIGHKGFVQAIVRFEDVQPETYAQTEITHQAAATADSA
ncbi:MAG TPA: hypothetical protein VKA67_00840 [Verrucomicrobiae bacterium]|nr:hypothetical protein [Verrucomicrobiae bacterium]